MLHSVWFDINHKQAVGGRPQRYAPDPHLPPGRRSEQMANADGNGNIASFSHGQPVPMPTAAAAGRTNKVMSKVA